MARTPPAKVLVACKQLIGNNLAMDRRGLVTELVELDIPTKSTDVSVLLHSQERRRSGRVA